jgi:hypothetical protein
MADVEAAVRSEVNRGLDCRESALRLIGLRKDLARLIGEWKAAGGGDLLSPHLQPRIGIRAAKTGGPTARAGSRR